MSLTVADFDEFFRAVNDGHPPFRWQRRMLAELVRTGRWPDRLVAPTGAGKSSVVDMHVFAVALSARGGARVPRRLAVVVNRRGLVDSHEQRANTICHLLVSASPESVLGRTAAALMQLRTSQHDNKVGEPFDIVNLRGGLPPQRDWVSDPSACQVICATPDMWGSRVLFRGYGTSYLARPREAGLLTHDAVIVLDEAHLNRQLLLTARRITELAAPTSTRIGVPALQVVETTATPAEPGATAYTEAGVITDDLIDDHDPALTARLTTAKPVRRLADPNWPPRSGNSRTRYTDTLVSEAIRLVTTYGTRGSTGRTVGCFVNTVPLAAEVAERMRAQGFTVELLVGRLRPYDLDQLQTTRPDLLTVRGDNTVDVLVATQTLEVGVDVDLAALVTELAPAQAISQRAGRVNRLGRADTTEIVIVGPAPDSDLFAPPQGKQSRQLVVLPYATAGDTDRYEQLIHTWEWLGEREADPRGLAPWAVATAPGPRTGLDRTLLQRLEPYDVAYLARTGGDLFAEPDLELWLRDSLDREPTPCGIVVRSHRPADPNATAELLQATPPVNDEIYPASMHTTRQVIRAITDDGGDVYVYRNDTIEILETTDPEGGRIRPGDIVIVDEKHPIIQANVVTETPNAPGTDIFDAVTEGTCWRFVAGMSDAIDTMLDDLADLAESSEGQPTEPELRQLLSVEYGADQQLDSLRDAPRRARVEIQRAWGALDDPDSRWLVVSVPETVDDTIRQVWSRNRVLLDNHNTDVGARARALAERLGLVVDLHKDLDTAGRWHDSGKRLPRFQRVRLANPNPHSELLAKSPGRRQPQLVTSVGGLPPSWRHEQLSAAIARTDGHDDLTVRLVGTSHGHGRPGFPHVTTELLNPDEETTMRQAAEDLFDHGEWDTLLDTTHNHWGVWGCAYLEAILRAADSQISAEGR
ncbi:type I-U CRISPR-associated helicase/endonuclease Cas3 [Nocardia transvalensis]|uniref:type I-G CRISPR-associated helicase/endonuclease Cas3g n=1 Tax=Nocardia transvalensis TaxID=37333 RepID=UPI00189627A7|nr:type I-U CRISPR-associated helicase/endonuclease Cas3 [Nocardia transvalensis]MBF6332410.1 type I-U CRISPR-associated helicase/endonuclease Cas3 [Nocardia transvalensis]